MNSRATITFCWLPPERCRPRSSDARACARRNRCMPLGRRSLSISSLLQRRSRREWARGSRCSSTMFSATGKLEHQPVALAVLGDVRDAQLDDVAAGRRASRDVLADQDRPVPAIVPQAGERLDQLGLAVALHAGDADDLARVHRQARPRRPRCCRGRRGRASRARQHRRAGLAAALSTSSCTSRPTIMRASSASSVASWGRSCRRPCPRAAR